TNLSSVANAHYYWNFGDGSTSYSTSPLHVFVESGTFLVTLHMLDTVSQCHSFHQEWLPITRYSAEPCQPFTTDSVFQYNGNDYVKVIDGSTDCVDFYKYIDAGPAQNFQPNNSINLTSWQNALFLSRMRYVSYDSISGTQVRRIYYRTLPYNDDPAVSYDPCSADFEYTIDYQPGGAVGTFRPLGSAAADTIWITGYGNPIPLTGPVSTFLFPYYGGTTPHWQNVWRRNYDPNSGCHAFHAQTLLIKDPYYVLPPSCLIDPQPQDAVVYQNGTAEFIINTEPGAYRQWQQNAGLGWQDLFDAGPYSGVHTDTLSVANCQNWWSNYQFRCVVTSPGSSCHNTSTVAVLTVMVGIEEAAQDLYYLYPNPATDVIRLHWNSGPRESDLRIFDAVGHLAKSAYMAGPTADVDVSDLAPGLYLLTATWQGRELRSRFVKR
ncbi:MAG: T9SS type A sorting domain-containing protein, partial [Flavobacteriales bacterium]|nr:T9SS type A sorting domain-containing protein [Flavobacteriales bacterium]